MVKRSCSTPGCSKPHRARGLCSTHYNQENAKPIEVTCAACGDPVARTTQQNRDRYRPTCSVACRSFLQHGAPVSIVPITHPSRMPLACEVPTSHPIRSTPVPHDHPSRRRRIPGFHAGLCKECGQGFVVASEYVGTTIRYCSMTCQRRTTRRARRAREAGASGSFTWDGFKRLTLSLGNACAYCDGDNNGQPFEPDHVVPLSRHGHNGLTNILPACRRCNGDKRDLLMHEWAADRENRGLPHVRYDVGRFTHLTAHDHALVAA